MPAFPRILVLVAALLALAAPGAAAQSTNAPPGNSGVDQYLETVPGATGNRPAKDHKPAGRLPSDVRRALEKAGPDGRKLLELTESTAPRGALEAARKAAKERRAKGDGNTAAGNGADQSEPGGKAGAGAAVVTALTGSGEDGMGWLLPALLIGSTAIILGLGLARRRGRA